MPHEWTRNRPAVSTETPVEIGCLATYTTQVACGKA